MQKLSLTELNRLSTEDFKKQEKIPVVIVLDNIRSQNNVGSVFRTSDAFKISGILLCGITATPPHREIHRTALGAEDSVRWEYFSETMDAVRLLKEEGFLIYAIEQARGSKFLNDFFPPKGKKIALIFGNEVKGVDEIVMESVDGCIEIPQFGTKHSFNISVSAGIVLWDLFNKLV